MTRPAAEQAENRSLFSRARELTQSGYSLKRALEIAEQEDARGALGPEPQFRETARELLANYPPPAPTPVVPPRRTRR